MRFHIIKIKRWKKILIAGLLLASPLGLLQAQMNMNPYFTAINYPLEKHSLMLMAMSDFQSAAHRVGVYVWAVNCLCNEDGQMIFIKPEKC